jgi:uncharacterized RDD family membrane protein YckC
MMQDQAQITVRTAGFGERLVAYLIDVIVIVFIELVLILLLGQPLGSLLAFVASIAYVVGFWMAQGTTPGKMAMGLQIVRQDGRPMDGSTALLRYVGYIVSGIVVWLGFLWIIWDPNHEGWHDKIAKTWVIKTQR